KRFAISPRSAVSTCAWVTRAIRDSIARAKTAVRARSRSWVSESSCEIDDWESRSLPTTHCVPAGNTSCPSVSDEFQPGPAPPGAGPPGAVAEGRRAHPEPDARGLAEIGVLVVRVRRPAPRPDRREVQLLGDLLRGEGLPLHDLEPRLRRLEARSAAVRGVA